MQEAIGYAQKVGVPSVFVNVMRVGPATGMPTMPGQGDIMQVKWGSTGDYTPIAFYPNGVEEAFRVTVEAFNAAEESRSPVVILSDTFVAHLNEVVDLDAAEESLAVTPRTVPRLAEHTDQPRFFAGVLMSEHGPNAGEPATADADEYLRQFYEAKHRHLEVARRYARYEHAWNTNADVLIVGYGIVSRVAAPLREDYALFRPIRIHPMLDEELRGIAQRYRDVVVVEANDGQYADMVELALHRPVKRVPLLGGRISLEAVREGIERVLSGGPSEPPIAPAPMERVAPSPLGAA
jgi:2-oxoglutarate/2-oxoacid ferredoxin oxidoreductase subunit alpha